MNETVETTSALAAPASFALARPGSIATAEVRKKAFRASRAPTVSHSMIPVGACITGKITKIEIPKLAKFKTPMITVELDNGAEVVLPGSASLMSVIDPEEKGAAEWKECVNRRISATKLGMKHSKEYDVDFPVFDVVIE